MSLERLPLREGNSRLTYSSVVRQWECDRNDHWNMQYYVRAFQVASEVLAHALTGANPGSASATLRHYRFHRELRCPQTMRIRSSRIAGGAFDGAVIHWMEAGATGELSATAIEWPAYPVGALPARAEADLARALPRGLSAAPHVWNPAAARLPAAPAGVVRPAEVDHTGDILANELVARNSAGSHQLLNRLGLTVDWIDRTNCNRMAVEVKVGRHGPARAGEMLEVASWVSEIGTRSFTIHHQMANATTGRPCASIEILMLVIDLGTRRATAVPGFVQEARERLGLGAPG